MRLLFTVVSCLIVAGCGSTGVIQLDQGEYMVSVKSAKVGFVSAAEEKADAYKEANSFCSKQNKSVETTSLEMRDSGPMRSASATLSFRCVDL